MNGWEYPFDILHGLIFSIRVFEIFFIFQMDMLQIDDNIENNLNTFTKNIGFIKLPQQ